jgi:hypothetical protein
MRQLLAWFDWVLFGLAESIAGIRVARCEDSDLVLW